MREVTPENAAEYLRDTGRVSDGREIQAQYDLLAKFSDRGVLDLAFRASALAPDKLSSVLDYIEFQASKQEGDEDIGTMSQAVADETAEPSPVRRCRHTLIHIPPHLNYRCNNRSIARFPSGQCAISSRIDLRRPS